MKCVVVFAVADKGDHDILSPTCHNVYLVMKEVTNTQ